MKKVLLAMLVSSTAHAQPAVSDIEVPVVIIGDTDQTTGQTDEALDLANIVQSAAKGITTVQEAPAIVTVVTADEIKDRQFQTIEDLVDTVPGWYRSSVYYSNFPTPLVRGQVQAVQYLHDGLSMFDVQANVPSISRVLPLELVKRVEMITGPGGVLWGSNSLLGILNVITKDAEDVDGVEVGGGLGDGRGDRNMARAYVMAGHVEG
ncbi:MAG TPA: TonB-dependent receptor plug domain-containing protein, partial [Kofleriaceae bacterium]